MAAQQGKILAEVYGKTVFFVFYVAPPLAILFATYFRKERTRVQMSSILKVYMARNKKNNELFSL